MMTANLLPHLPRSLPSPARTQALQVMGHIWMRMSIIITRMPPTPRTRGIITCSR